LNKGRDTAVLLYIRGTTQEEFQKRKIETPTKINRKHPSTLPKIKKKIKKIEEKKDKNDN
jgi:hypothetical protein